MLPNWNAHSDDEDRSPELKQKVKNVTIVDRLVTATAIVLAVLLGPGLLIDFPDCLSMA